MKKILCALLAAAAPFISAEAGKYSVKSPDKAYELRVEAGDGATFYSLDYKGKGLSTARSSA